MSLNVWNLCSRVPQTRMFGTFVGAVLRTGRSKKKGKKGKRSSVVEEEGASYDGDGRPLEEVLEAIITRRLRKLEGLRAYLRNHMKAFRLSGGSRGAFYVASTTDTASTLRSPVTRLSMQQSFLVGRPHSNSLIDASFQSRNGSADAYFCVIEWGSHLKSVRLCVRRYNSCVHTAGAGYPDGWPQSHAPRRK
jgi:hypothetical protein